jgi:hypothetical protein
VVAVAVLQVLQALQALQHNNSVCLSEPSLSG